MQEGYEEEGQGETEESLKRRILEQRRMQERASEAEARINALLSQLLAPEARQRLSNLRIANSEAYGKAVQALAYYAQSQKPKERISDGQLRQLLESISRMGKREIRIKRK